MLVVPLFVRTIVWLLFAPTTTLPKATLPGLGFRVAPATTPVPTSASDCGEFGPLSVKEISPAAAPEAVGVNCTLKDTLCPAPMVAGFESPLIPKGAPLTVAGLIVRLMFPVFVSFTVWLELCPTVTLPKLTVAGVMVRLACIPVPVRVTVRGEFDASLVTVIEPLIAPEACGANWT